MTSHSHWLFGDTNVHKQSETHPINACKGMHAGDDVGSIGTMLNVLWIPVTTSRDFYLDTNNCFEEMASAMCWDFKYHFR